MPAVPERDVVHGRVDELVLQSLTLALALTPSSASAMLSKRACYATGEVWGAQYDAAMARVDEACSVAGGMGGRDYAYGETVTKCYGIGGGKSVVLTTTRRTDAQHGPFLPVTDCASRLRREIRSCERGGAKPTEDWNIAYVDLFHVLPL